MVGGVKAIILLAMAVVLVGCGKKEPPSETALLKAENEKLRADTEVARLKAENARLKAELANNGGISTPVPTGETKTCYWCKESIKAAAQICKNCGKNPSEPIVMNEIVEKRVRQLLNKPTGEFFEEDLTPVTYLYLAETKLTKLPEGLEKFTQLDHLSLNRNQLTSVKGLENLTQLTELWLHGNKLTDVKDLEKLTQLTHLGLEGNQLTGVKGLEKLTQLTYLALRDNPALTKAQIDELKMALPKCKIFSDF
jgi:hypothetical protein